MYLTTRTLVYLVVVVVVVGNNKNVDPQKSVGSLRFQFLFFKNSPGPHFHLTVISSTTTTIMMTI